MQGLADLADSEECACARLLDFQRLLAASLNQPDEAVEDRQCGLRRFAFGGLQGFDDFCGFLGISHGARHIYERNIRSFFAQISAAFGGLNWTTSAREFVSSISGGRNDTERRF